MPEPNQPGVKPNEPAPTPGQEPGAPAPSKPAVPPAGTGVKPPEPGEQTDQTKLLAALHEERERRRELEEKLRLQVPEQQPLPSPTGNEAIRARLDELWETNPREAVQMELMLGFKWFDGVNSSLDQQRAMLRAKYPDFAQYESGAMEYVRTLPLEQRNANGIVEAAYFLQKGRSSDAIYKAAVDEVIRKIQAGESVQGLPSGTPQTSIPKGLQVTEEQMRAATAMGIPIEEYVKYIKK